MSGTFSAAVLACSSLLLAACHPGAVIGADPNRSVGGTIAGVVTSGAAPVTGRKVTAVNTATGARFDATTGQDGGYTIEVPQGTYRIEFETRPGETLTKKPDDTTVDSSDLDSARDFEIGASSR